MNTVIVILFCLQIVAILTAGFALALTFSPLRRVLQPVGRLIRIVTDVVDTFGKLLQRATAAFSAIGANVAAVGILLRRRKTTPKSWISIRKLVSIVITGNKLVGLVKRIRQPGRKGFWGMFRLLMFIAPAVVPILSSFRKRIRKPV